MTAEKHHNIQTFSAIGMLVVGSALSVAGFIVPPTGEISDSVLRFFAECLIYAGSIFGIGIYVNGKFADIEAYISHIIGHDKDNANTNTKKK